MPLSPKETVKEVQEFSYLVAKAFVAAFRRPYYVRDILTQMDLIAFNFHSAAAAVTALAPFEFMINEFEVDDQMSRETFDQSNEGLTVRFPSGSEAQHGLSIARNCLTLKESFL